MTITLPLAWSSFVFGVLFGWASLFLLAVWLQRRRKRGE